MDLTDRIFDTSRTAMPRIVLPEGNDERVVSAAVRAARDRLARITVLAQPETFEALAGDADDRDLVTVLDPRTSPQLNRYAEAYHQLRQHKGVDREAARVAMLSNLGFAAMMVRQGDSDGTIGGAVATTADTVRAALQIIGRAPSSEVVSSFFLMLLKEPFSRPVVFADCALIMLPTAEQLAAIAMTSAKSFEAMTGIEPRVAMLSFSTMGSAEHESIDRINRAIAIVRSKSPSLTIDGEIQFDAAIIPDVGRKKAPQASLQGDANVFIFPNLSAGNIGYKIAQRIGGATALGPILQGLARPANDLSRGCSAEDVFQMIAITGAQAAAQVGARISTGKESR